MLFYFIFVCLFLFWNIIWPPHFYYYFILFIYILYFILFYYLFHFHFGMKYYPQISSWDSSGHFEACFSYMPLPFSQTSRNESQTFNSWTWPQKCSCTVFSHLHDFNSENFNVSLDFVFKSQKLPWNASDSECWNRVWEMFTRCCRTEMWVSVFLLRVAVQSNCRFRKETQRFATAGVFWKRWRADRGCKSAFQPGDQPTAVPSVHILCEGEFSSDMTELHAPKVQASGICPVKSTWRKFTLFTTIIRVPGLIVHLFMLSQRIKFVFVIFHKTLITNNDNTYLYHDC